jgi:hypothetical protein
MEKTMKNNRFVQIAALALCLITVAYVATPMLGYRKIAPWALYNRWKVDHNGPEGKTTLGTWYQYSDLPGKNGGADWGQFICIAGGNEGRVGAHATGWIASSSDTSTELKTDAAFGPFEGPAFYNEDCNCYR